MTERGGPSLIRLNYGLQRHGGGGMAVRTITACRPSSAPGGTPAAARCSAPASSYPFNGAALERPDLIPPGTRTINMVQLAEALNGELPGPPVRALYVYNSNPAAVCPDQSRVLEGLRREDLFTVVHEQFQTDTADYADILLPATTQLEHFDMHRPTAICTCRPTSRPSRRWARRSRTPKCFGCWRGPWGSNRNCSRSPTKNWRRQALQVARVAGRLSAARGVRRHHPGTAACGKGPIRLIAAEGLRPVRRGQIRHAVGQVRILQPSSRNNGHGPAAPLRAAARRSADPARPGRALSVADGQPAGAVVSEFDRS